MAGLSLRVCAMAQPSQVRQPQRRCECENDTVVHLGVPLVIRTLLVCSMVMLMTQSSALAATVYSLTDLGTLGGTSSFGTALNDAGHATGYSLTAAGETRAFYWTPGGGMQNLGIIGTGSSQGLDINNNNDIVGQTGGKAFRWESGTGMVTIDGANNGSANGLNNSDAAVGSRAITVSTSRSLKWDSANTVSNPFPTTNSQAQAINDLGQYVGTTPAAGYYSTSTNAVTVLSMSPTDINNSRHIVGSLGGIAALLDFDTNMTTLLGKLNPSDPNSQALGINQAGTVVGVSNGSGAFIVDSSMTMASLTSLLDVGFAGWNILTATDINNSGSIIGVGQFNGVSHAVILTPVPEPTTCFLALSAALVVPLLRKTRQRNNRI